jgi:hypothetical protein
MLELSELLSGANFVLGASNAIDRAQNFRDQAKMQAKIAREDLRMGAFNAEQFKRQAYKKAMAIMTNTNRDVAKVEAGFASNGGIQGTSGEFIIQDIRNNGIRAAQEAMQSGQIKAINAIAYGSQGAAAQLTQSSTDEFQALKTYIDEGKQAIDYITSSLARGADVNKSAQPNAGRQLPTV